MTMSRDELTIEELLGDPVTRAVMAADRVDPSELETMLRSMALRFLALRSMTPAIERAADRRCEKSAFNGDGAQSQWATVHSSIRSQLCKAP
jgi:hypothetical protein